jgi:serine/threonine protein kinase
MRALRRWLRHKLGEVRLAKRREEVRMLLSEHIGRTCRLSPAGARGRDSIYTVHDSGHTFACLRVVNPYLKRTPLKPHMPFQVLSGIERIEREWSSYSRGAESGLTPRPLWRSDDALACEFVEGARVMDQLLSEPRRFWELISAATRAVCRLHEAGMTHMDVSLSNLVATPSGDLVFIDFEYAPTSNLDLAQQRAYDHLRLVESCIKFMPTEVTDGYRIWLDTLEQCTDAKLRCCDLNPLIPALGRVLAEGSMRNAIASLFDEQ